jgi:imidazolonepropionase
MTLFTNIASLVTVHADGALAKIGAAMRNVGEVRDAAVLFDEERIHWVGSSHAVDAALAALDVDSAEVDVVDCTGKTVMPGFVDSHTHMVHAGSRAHEFARRLSGVPYAQIAAEGGGILTTMKAVREASVDELVAVGDRLATSALEHGTTTIEIKSGYGLTLESELRMLEAIGVLRDEHEATIVATFMGAHDVPPEFRHDADAYVQHIIDVMLPAVAAQGIAMFCDAFPDQGFFSVDQAERVLRAAQGLGLRGKVHADEIANIGASAMAARLGLASADHLEFTTRENVAAMRDAGVICTLLPGTAYTLRLPYPDARMMIDEGAVVALATDCNPGSCLSENMQLMLSLACTNMGMSVEETIVAATLHGAAALGIADEVGSIEAGKRADLVIYDVPSYADIVYHFGVNHVWSVWVNGAEVA